ncbi:MAG: MarR family transcriptional regulator [Lachnospiraceae bacterium]|nr:MarR family transcriptional regulator [Lachnospiraceae bacterium]
MENLDERLLSAWLQLSVQIINERVVSDMPFNEALVCNLLSKANDSRLTATDLCEKTRILKSQMNRILNSLEEQGLIYRERSTADKRQVYVMLNKEKSGLYEREHTKNLQLVNRIIEKLGREKAESLIGDLAAISAITEEVFS